MTNSYTIPTQGKHDELVEEEAGQSATYEMDIWLNCPFCKERVNFRVVYREGEWHIVSVYGPSGDLAIHHEGEEEEK